MAWSAALDIDVPLLSDWNAEAVHAFGIGVDYRGLRDVAARSAFLVDGDGVVRGGWLYGPDEVPDHEELLAAARELAATP